MNRRPFDPRLRQIGVGILAFIACVALSAPMWAAERARLSKGVSDHLASGSRVPLDLIVRGSADEVDALAARQGLSIKRRLQSGAVLQASAAQIEALRDDPAVDHLSADVKVS